MDRARFSEIAHRGFRYWNPVDPALLDAWLDGLPLVPSARVLDVGCGRGEVLIRLAEGHGCAGLGVDTAGSSIEHARREAHRRVPDAGLEFRHAPFEPDELAAGSFALSVCIGSSHAAGGFADGLRTLASLVTPGGRVLFGEGFWKQDPDPEYLASLGCAPGDLRTHAANIDLAESLGLRVLDAHETTPGAWSVYEDGYHANVIDHLARHPDDPDADAMRECIERWRGAYLAWGRETLGFGLYLMQVAG
jgi:SAM-dependent methyltransferase